jgi:hypothetical protein
MAGMENFDHFDMAACGGIVMLFAAAYGITKRDTSLVEPKLALPEKIMVWLIVGMLSSVLLGASVYR